MKIVFWCSLIFIFYVYAGYPILLYLWTKYKTNKIQVRELSPLPMISILIAAKNEEANIGRRLDNLLSTEYPKEKMEIIIVSDGSSDGTSRIVIEKIYKQEALSSTNQQIAKIILLVLDESRGKAHALNEAYRAASGDYIVFTDCRQVFKKDAIKRLLSNFSDPRIGCVSGELIFNKNTGSSIEEEVEIYWNLEKRIRKMESEIGSVAGATGAIYAIRKHLYTPMPDRLILDDVYVPMKIVCAGYRTLFDSGAIAFDRVSEDYSKERARKIRTLLGNYQLLKYMPELLSPLKNPIFLRFISHKVLRLFVPYFILSLFISSYFEKGVVYDAIFYLMLIMITLPFFDKALSHIPTISILAKISRTFIALNYFALLAFLKLLKSKNEDIW